MANLYAYVTTKLKDPDSIPDAMKKSREEACKKLGGHDIALFQSTWGPDWLCTTWRRFVEDQPNELGN